MHDLAASGAGSSVSGRSAAGAQAAAIQVSSVLGVQAVRACLVLAALACSRHLTLPGSPVALGQDAAVVLQ